MKKEIKDFVLKTCGEITKAVKLVVKGIAEYAGEALSACEAKKAAADIQMQGMLHNLQIQAMREYPRVPLNSAQEMEFIFPECRGRGAYIQLDSEQSEQVFQHMLNQYCLDRESQSKLAIIIAPKVGIPSLLELLATAHETVCKELIIPLINKGALAENRIDYEDTVNDPLFTGTNQDIKLKYNLHSSDKCTTFFFEYHKSRQLVNSIRRKLRFVGVDIDHIKKDGIYLEIYLK